MRLRSIVLCLVGALLLASCGGGSVSQETTTTAPVTTSQAVATTSMPPQTSTTTVAEGVVSAASPDFCQAITEFTTVLVLSAFADLTGDGAQDLFLVAKLPELTATSARVAETAPPGLADQARTLGAMYQKATDLAAERGLAKSDLETLALQIEEESLTVEQLFAGLGLTPTDLSQLFEDAAVAISQMVPPVDLVGVELADIGCLPPQASVSACALIADDDLTTYLGDSYTSEAKVIEGFGESCTFRGDDGVRFIDVTLAGPTFYLPAAWNEIELIEGVGDEAFLTTGLSSPFLYAKSGDVVVAVLAANFDPKLTTAELSALAVGALQKASE